MNKGVVVIGLLLILIAGGGYYAWKVNKPDIVSQFNVTNDKIAKDLEGRTAPLPYGQMWPFEPSQGITATIVSKKQVDDFIVVVVEVKASAEVTPPKAEGKEDKAPPPGIKSVRVGLAGLLKLTYEKIGTDWYIVGVESVSLRAYPLVNEQ